MIKKISSEISVLVPVYQGGIVAILEVGEGWSVLEQLVLFLLSKNKKSIEQLVSETHMPWVIVTESVIRLMKAECLEISVERNRIFYGATLLGEALAKYDELPHMKRKYTRVIRYVLDQVSGQLIDPSFIKVYSEEEARKICKKYEIEVLPSRLSISDTPSDISLLFERMEGTTLINDYESPVDCDFEGCWREDGYYIIVGDRNSPVSSGVPEIVENRIMQDLVLLKPQLSFNRTKVEVERGSLQELSNLKDFPSITFQPSDVVVGGPAHEKILHEILASACEYVIICSTFLYKNRLENQIEHLKLAAERGVIIVIVWDMDRTSEEHGKILQDCISLIKENDLGRSVFLTDFEIGSHGKLIIADDGNFNVFAVIGTCNWFSSSFRSMEVSVKLRSPRLIAEAICVLDDFLCGEASYLYKSRGWLAQKVSVLKNQKEHPSRYRGALVRQSEHDDYMLYARDMARKNIYVCCHKLGNSAENQVLDPLCEALRRRPEIDISVHYSSIKDTSSLTKSYVEEMHVRYSKLKLAKRKSLHAKLLTWDQDHVLITSLNWLSKDAKPSKPLGEIGVYIEGPAIADSFSFDV